MIHMCRRRWKTEIVTGSRLLFYLDKGLDICKLTNYKEETGSGRLRALIGGGFRYIPNGRWMVQEQDVKTPRHNKVLWCKRCKRNHYRGPACMMPDITIFASALNNILIAGGAGLRYHKYIENIT